MTSVSKFSYARLQALARRAFVAENGAPRLSELEMQARVFAGEFGVSWQGESGEKVEVVHFGIWNREPGPDFCRALVLIDGEKFAGDIEIDQDARDWETHGHSQNPAYENVVLAFVLSPRAAAILYKNSTKQGGDAGLSHIQGRVKMRS